MQIKVKTDNGGSVLFNEEHHVWASFGVMPSCELLYASATLDDGRQVAFCLNRKTGLIEVDVMDAYGEGEKEILRCTA
jgi:hypothetical protein